MHSIKQIVNCELSSQGGWASGPKIYHACPERSRRGFTLVELLVSVAILLLILGAAVSVEVQSIKLADTNEHSLQATNLAQQRLNFVKTIRDQNILDNEAPFVGWDEAGTTAVTKTVFASVQKSDGLLIYDTAFPEGVPSIYSGAGKLLYRIDTAVTGACDLGSPGCGP